MNIGAQGSTTRVVMHDMTTFSEIVDNWADRKGL